MLELITPDTEKKRNEIMQNIISLKSIFYDKAKDVVEGDDYTYSNLIHNLNRNRVDIVFKLIDLKNKNLKDLFLICNDNTYAENIDFSKFSKLELEAAIEIDPQLISIIPSSQHTKFMSKIVMNKWDIGACFLRDDLVNEKIIEELICKNPNVIKLFTKSKHITQKHYEMAILRKNSLINYIPKTEELCNLAVEIDSYNLVYLSRNNITKEMILDAIDRDTRLGIRFNIRCISNYNEFMGDNDIQMKALSNNPKNIKYLKDIINLPEDYLINLIKLKPKVFKHLITFQTQEMCNIAVELRPRNLEKVKLEFQTYEMCKKAVSKFGTLLECVKTSYITEELVCLAIDDFISYDINPQSILKYMTHPNKEILQLINEREEKYTAEEQEELIDENSKKDSLNRMYRSAFVTEPNALRNFINTIL